MTELRCQKERKLTSSNCENVYTEEERDPGSSMVHKLFGATGNNENMPNAADNDTPKDHIVSTSSSIRKISYNERQAVGKEVERLIRGILKIHKAQNISYELAMWHSGRIKKKPKKKKKNLRSLVDLNLMHPGSLHFLSEVHRSHCLPAAEAD